jgi:hypothetical protein
MIACARAKRAGMLTTQWDSPCAKLPSLALRGSEHGRERNVTGSVLIIDDDEARRRALVSSMKARGHGVLDVADAFAGMAALGRADFVAVFAVESSRTLSLRGLLQLARRRHPGIHLVIAVAGAGSVVSHQVRLQAALEVPLHVVVVHDAWDRLVTELLATMPTVQPEENPFAQPGSDPGELVEVELDTPIGESERRFELHGSFADDVDGSGAAMLMSLLVQQLTGTLDIDVPAAPDDSGTLYLHRGEPVWTQPSLGDSALYRQLVRSRVLSAQTPVVAVPEGELMRSLVDAGSVTYQDMQDFMRERTRAVVMLIGSTTTGTYVFREDLQLLDNEPEMRVNPFGLMVESRKRTLGPSRIMALGMEIESQYLIPGPGLGQADERLKPFFNGHQASRVVDGTATVQAFTQRVGLDLFMGTLLVLTLQATRLVSLEQLPRQQDVDLNERNFADNELAAVVHRVHTQQQPRGVLGVGIGADEHAVASAYQRRRAFLEQALITRVISVGEHGALMAKIDSAHAALRATVVELDDF